jgi:hypothetical protein
MSLSTEQMKELASVLEARLRGNAGLPGTYTYEVEGPEVIARYGDGGSDTYNLTFAGERIVIGKLGWNIFCGGESKNPETWEYSIATWDDDTAFYPTLSQAIEAAVKAWLSTDRSNQ